MNAGRMLVSMLITGAVLGAASLSATKASERPDVAFVAAALRNQETACGASLRVRYTRDWLASTGPSLHEETLYVRTPGVLFKQSTMGTKSPSKGFQVEGTEKRRYDRKSGALVVLGTSQPDGHSMARLETAKETPSGFVGTGLVDPALYPIRHFGPMKEVVTQGAMGESQEDIDGHKCWRIDIAPRQIGSDTRSSWSIWVDPDIGFCPRRIKESTTQYGKDGVCITDFTDYALIGNQVYFPMRVTVKLDEAGTHGSVFVIQEATCGKEVKDEDIAAVIPSGTEVRVPGQQLEYTQP